ncbi:MAG: hypothetical protein AAGD09_12560 [Cyanobacteria bacterium P01_F01_bin.56]
MQNNTMFLLLTILFLGLLLPGCEIKNMLKSRETRTAWLPVRGLSAEQAILLQVKNLSRDLERCLERTGQSSFSDENFLGLVNKAGKISQMETETYSINFCNKTLSYLMEKINSALESGNSEKEVFEALLEGQSEVVLEHDITVP